MNTNLNRSDSDPMAMIYHCGTLSVNFRLDLCTIYHHLAKINAHVYSEIEEKKTNRNDHKCADAEACLESASAQTTHHDRIHSKATFYKIQLN